jgi:hypothetical protein
MARIRTTASLVTFTSSETI